MCYWWGSAKCSLGVNTLVCVWILGLLQIQIHYDRSIIWLPQPSVGHDIPLCASNFIRRCADGFFSSLNTGSHIRYPIILFLETFHLTGNKMPQKGTILWHVGFVTCVAPERVAKQCAWVWALPIADACILDFWNVIIISCMYIGINGCVFIRLCLYYTPAGMDA